MMFAFEMYSTILELYENGINDINETVSHCLHW